PQPTCHARPAVVPPPEVRNPTCRRRRCTRGRRSLGGVHTASGARRGLLESAHMREPVLLRILRAALDAPGAPPAGEHLLVAVSGGPDSTALLVGLAELAAERGLQLTAAHVDHALRGAESAREGEAVAAVARRLGIES